MKCHQLKELMAGIIQNMPRGDMMNAALPMIEQE